MLFYSYSISHDTYQPIIKGEDSNVAAMVNVVLPHDGVGVVLHPDTGQCVATDLVLFIHTLQHTKPR
jgi:hypothetical protein